MVSDQKMTEAETPKAVTPEEIAERGVYLKHHGHNCCQSSLLALAESNPSIKLDPETLKSLGAGFAGGMGNMEGACGALCGAEMYAGLVTDGKGTIKFAKEINEDFAQTCGSVICKELKGKGTGKVLCECDNCVRNAILSAKKVLG